ncbi:PAS domain S-box-containing protein [Thioalkalivibrio sp. ALE21]|uniref:PAS domain S-box protein n=1 Tax=Thioalkalivibrio sp. ALE21 TaxID=1158175 RepID=UPI000D86CA0A|nr:PAS domain S-box protein [Thioalkalivibrio sp. ALE21]PYG01338.1 PAS domain S-box-containing protein [Thioalkalivibrio sp. ALE21]
MRAPPTPEDEDRRLAGVRRLLLEETDGERLFAPLLRQAAARLEVPITVVSVIDHDHQRLLGAYGACHRRIPREVSLCAHAIATPQHTTIVDDATDDPRFADNPLVTGEPGVRFYAGIPLTLEDGLAVGTLSVMDTRPRRFDADRIRALEDFAGLAGHILRTEFLRGDYDATRSAHEHQSRKLHAVLETAAAGIIQIDAGGLIESFNPAAERLFGYSAAEVLGHNVSMLMPDPWASQHDDYLRHYQATGEARIIGIDREVRGLHRDGHTFPMQLAVSSIRIDGGEHYIGIVNDLTELHEAQERELRESRLFNAVLRGAPNPIYASDADGRYVVANPACEPLLGFAPEKALGSTAHDLFSADVADYARGLDHEVMTTGQTRTQPLHFEHNGRSWELELIKTPLVGEDGRSEGVITVAHDLSEITHAQNALREAERRRSLSQRFARIGNWSVDAVTGELDWTPEAAALTKGAEHPALQDPRFLTDIVLPEDRPRVQGALNESLASGTPLDVEFRIRTSPPRWLRAQGDLERDDRGRPRHLLGIVQDIDAYRNATAQQQRQQHLLEAMRLATTQYMETDSAEDVWPFLLDTLLQVTDSHYGFMGETEWHDGQPCLKIHAITNLAWSDASERLYQELLSGDMRLCGANSLIGRVMHEGRMLISDDVMTDPRAGGLPEGHPELGPYLGMPLYHGDELVGMFGIADRPGGYDQELADFLAPFSATYAILIRALRDREARRRDRKELERAMHEAERASRAKSQFLSNMSHELRTPLNSILGFAQLLAESPREPLSERQARQVGHIRESGTHLLSLISDVLDLSRIETGRLTLSPEATAIGAVLREALDMVRPLAEERSVALHHPDPATAWPTVHADPTRARQILINLLSNAIKYNRPDGRVDVIVQAERNDATADPGRDPEHGMLNVEVHDTGYGIPEEHQERLFQPFERLEQEGGGVEGTGIGLVISRELATRMGGELDFSSTEGEGSCFRIRLPLGQPSSAADAPDRAPPDPAEGHAGDADADTGAAPAAVRRILYIEDNLANVELMRELLRNRGRTELRVAGSAEQGLITAREWLPDLIVLDVHLPGMSGTAAARVLKSRPETRHIPLIALSADATREKAGEGNQNPDFEDYLTKPLDIPAFMRSLDRLLNPTDD